MRKGWSLRLLVSAGLVCTLLSSSLMAQTKTPPPKTQAASPGPKKVPWWVKKKKKDDRAWVGSPGFRQLPGGRSVVFLRISKEAKVTEHIAAGKITYAIHDTRVQYYNNKYALETYYYNTPVLRVRLQSLRKDPDLLLNIELRNDVKPEHRLKKLADGSMVLEVEFPAGQFKPSNENDEHDGQNWRSAYWGSHKQNHRRRYYQRKQYQVRKQPRQRSSLGTQLAISHPCFLPGQEWLGNVCVCGYGRQLPRAIPMTQEPLVLKKAMVGHESGPCWMLEVPNIRAIYLFFLVILSFLD
jgi:hypothetical protein